MQTDTIDHEVLIAGAGPTGLMLAAELKLAGVEAAIVEPRLTQDLAGSRASGLHARTLEIFDMRGIVDRFLAVGQRVPMFMFNGERVDLSDLPTRYGCTLAILQEPIERILAGWAEELGVTIHRGREVISFTQDDTGVSVRTTAAAGTRSIRARYLVGCDGARSIVRKAAGVEFAGSDPSMSWMIAEVSTTEEPAWGFRETPAGIHAIGKRNGLVGIVIAEPTPRRGDPSLDELRQALVEIYGTDFGVHAPKWLSRFSDAARKAVTYRAGRVLLAGDAAHIHAPMGGQGLNIGVQDAVNLGWKLARVVKSQAADSLLDSYTAERHPVAARVLQTTMAQSALRRTDDYSKALSRLVGRFMTMQEPRRALAAEISGLGVHYDLGDGHPLLGRRMPDLELRSRDGGGAPFTVFSLLRAAKPVVIQFDDSAAIDTDARVIRAAYSGVVDLPVLGPVPLPAAVLIRPDGYVAAVIPSTPVIPKERSD